MVSSIAWNKRMLGLAKFIAYWSKDPTTQVGCVIADSEHRILGIGYNGFPRGIKDSYDRLFHRPTKLKLMIHAETNAIKNAAQNVSGATLYSTLPPCIECAKDIIQHKISRVVYLKPCPEHKDRWQEQWDFSLPMLREVNIDVVEFGD